MSGKSLREGSRLLQPSVNRTFNGDLLSEDANQNATLFGSCVNLMTGIVGVGVLSFPYAFLQSGVYLNIAFTLAFGVVNVYSVMLMSRTFTERLIRTNQLKPEHATFEGIVLVIISSTQKAFYQIIFRQHYLGPTAYYLITACILFTIIGVLTAYFIVAADLGQPVLVEVDFLPHRENVNHSKRSGYMLTVLLGTFLLREWLLSCSSLSFSRSRFPCSAICIICRSQA